MGNSIVGTRVGIFDVLYECDKISSSRHKIYHVKCTQCGWEADMQKHHIIKATTCTHIGINGQYKQYDYEWNNKRLCAIFKDMKGRCYNPNVKSYRWYGARGIQVCDEWLNNPKAFEEWALANGYTDDLTINRKNENKNYCPENCEWVTLEYNSKYKSTTSLIEVDGEVHSGTDWAKKFGFGKNTINKYVNKYGMENTVEFIKRYQSNPILKSTKKQSYYSLYMNQEITKSEENL